ncbi:1-deoxy-D-xylulose-5-phosphate synthase [Sansalvadorimonas verongulae]|uniref:1-deoxy-D-xylulose-5-phosphate synthase n=1 Tax=Sansalvadorimonas verongulae TaxID=2172824 RepID=UPI0012BCC79F|nr:1-deoxy-D-xylulose-5-phosphate synthase [Sansalvadorimonas verongulae]MTI14489.1 1-deoxy-D-xylulose-5-phosphate synthase [Sansalvadorimonas verongulae]
MPLLDSISYPSDLRKLKPEQLPELAQELRVFLTSSVYQTGGHLGAGLGVIELTIALHYLFDTPDDRLIWDVGHQCYPHKILTGRKEAMTSLRQTDGLCGFPSREESPYDAFGTGHSSTSISAALGMAMAARAKGEHRQAIAVIGDGAMTAGQAFEALNHAACMKANLLVILNDNDMSISPSVGMLARYLRGIQATSGRAPAQDPVVRFEDHSMTMAGPISGHDLPALLDTLERLKNQPGPRLLHVVTRKGKGLPEAEADPVKYHAVAKVSGENEPEKVKKPSWSNRFGHWLCATAARDKRLFGITPAMREGSDLVQFSELFPERYCDVAIAEQHAVTLAGGMACEGMKPVVAIYSTFLQRGYDQLIHDIALQNLDVLFALDRAGLVGEDGPTHHGLYDIAALKAIPNMVLMAPSDELELNQMLTFGYDYKGPAAVRYPRGPAQEALLSGHDFALEMGKGRILRNGQSVAILGFGPLTKLALGVAEQANVTVADMRFVKPLDTALIQQLAEEHSLLITLEEGAVKGGIGEEVAALLQGFDTEVVNLGIPDQFIAHGNKADQLKQCGVTAENILSLISRRLG